MLKKFEIIFKVFIILLFSISITKAELLKPNSDIKPSKVVEIQLSGLQKNDLNYKDSGIEQTWNFAHPSNKKNTGPLPNFKMMIKIIVRIFFTFTYFSTLVFFFLKKLRYLLLHPSPSYCMSSFD